MAAGGSLNFLIPLAIISFSIEQGREFHPPIDAGREVLGQDTVVGNVIQRGKEDLGLGNVAKDIKLRLQGREKINTLCKRWPPPPPELLLQAFFARAVSAQACPEWEVCEASPGPCPLAPNRELRSQDFGSPPARARLCYAFKAAAKPKPKVCIFSPQTPF